MPTPQIYDILKREHEQVSELFHELERARGATALRLFHRLRAELVPHSRAEEAVLYARLLKEFETRDQILESLEEHKQIDRLVVEIGAADVDDDIWSAKVKVLADMVGHHVDEEEGELFPRARQILSDREAERLAEEYARERDAFAAALQTEAPRGAAA